MIYSCQLFLRFFCFLFCYGFFLLLLLLFFVSLSCPYVSASVRRDSDVAEWTIHAVSANCAYFGMDGSCVTVEVSLSFSQSTYTSQFSLKIRRYLTFKYYSIAVHFLCDRHFINISTCRVTKGKDQNLSLQKGVFIHIYT